MVALARYSGAGALPILLRQQLCRANTEGFRNLPEGEERDILLSPLHQAYVSTVNAHPLGQRGLAQIRLPPNSGDIPPEELPDVHLKDGHRVRILVRRIIIRGSRSDDPAMSSVEATDTPAEAAPRAVVERLYLRNRDWLLAFLNRRFGSLVGEDAAQEAFVRTLASGSVVRNPRAFLAKVAIRAALEEVRRRPELGMTYAAPSVSLPDAEQALLLEQTIQALPEPIRDVFVLSRFGGLSNVEIAQRCNLSVKRVEARLTEARRRCAALMRD